jgi:hypothetical protein
MSVEFAAIEAVVAGVGSIAVGGAFAIRLLRPPSSTEGGSWTATVLRISPAIVATFVLLLVGRIAGGSSNGPPFDLGVVVGAAAAFALLALAAVPAESEGPGPAERPLPLSVAATGVGAAGLAMLAVLVVLVGIGPGPSGLFGVALGPGVLLLLGEPASRLDPRLRFAGLVAALAVATAMVPDAVILRIIIPDALFLPLLVVALGTVAGVVGLLFDRIDGPFRIGAPAAAVVAVGMAGAAVATWMPGDAEVTVVVLSGWVAAVGSMYLLRLAVFEPAEAEESARAGTALGVIGSFARGLRTVGGAVLVVAVPAFVAYEAVVAYTPEGAFGVVLAGVGATAAAVVLGGIRVSSGPVGRPRQVPEVLDAVAAGWGALAVALALPYILPSVTSLAPALLGAALALGSPPTLAGLVLGSIVPFLIASVPSVAGRADVSGRARRWGAALLPAVVAIVVAVTLGPPALVALVLGAALTGLPLGVLWAAAREASASLEAELRPTSPTRTTLAAAFESGPGWRSAAAVLGTAVAVLGIVAVAVPASGLFRP